jgi:CubicO group peptidase (beta-lactamase class C family)
MIQRRKLTMGASLIISALAPLPALAQAYDAEHGLSPAQYQASFDDHTKKGYRLVCISGYESNDKERYAALWIKQGGPLWSARHGLSGAGYQAAVTDFEKQGMRPTWVQGYTINGKERYTAIFEKKGGAWGARHGLTGAEFQKAFNDMDKAGFRIAHLNGYAVGGSARYAAIWEKAGGPGLSVKHGMSASAYQTEFNSHARQGFRLKQVSGFRVGGGDYYSAIWEKTGGPYWSARHGVPDSWYQNVFENYMYQGYRPKYISAFTSGGRGKLNCVWENPVFKGSDLEFIDSKVRDYLSKYGAPGAAIAITKDGRLVYASGFGQADQSTGEEAGAGSLFRIASVSKPITSVAIMKLVESGRVSLDEKVFGPNSILGAAYPTPSNNKKIENIKVRDLLQHVSGLGNTPNDPMFQNLSYSHSELIKWVLNADDRKMTRDPRDLYEYFNFGYTLLGRIIEQKTRVSYEQYVRQNILAPCGISKMVVGKNKLSQQFPREVRYYPSSAYDLNVTRFDAHGGWIASPIDLVRFMVRVDGQPSKPDMISASSRTAMVTKAGINDFKTGKDPNYGFGWACNPQSHNGAMSGTVAIMASTNNGYTYAAVVNTRPADDGFAGNLSNMVQSIINGVSAWPSHDLF